MRQQSVQVKERTAGRRVRIAAGILVVLLAAGAVGAWALVSAPTVLSQTPARGTAKEQPTLVVYLKGADALTDAQLHASVDGIRVDRYAHVRGGTVVVRLPKTSEGTHVAHVWTERFGVLRHRVDTQWKFRVDTTAPKFELTAPPGHRVRSDVRHVRFAVDSEPGVRLIVTAGDSRAVGRSDDDGHASTTIALGQGSQQVHVRVVDEVGNDATKDLKVFVDSIPPQVTTALADGTTATKDFATTVSATDATKLAVTATIDGSDEDVDVTGGPGDDGAARPWTVSRKEPLSEGQHVIALSATDAVGNVTTVTRHVLVDSSEELGDNAIGHGAKGNDVHELQVLLQKQGLFKPAGHMREVNLKTYGPGTAAAVRAFQSAHSIDADGVAGDETLSVMTLKITVNRATHVLTLFRLGKVVKTYGVAVGQPKYPTPAGSFHIVKMEENPTWTPPPTAEWAKGEKAIPPGPDNPLGTRWMGLDAPGGDVGIHGTNTPSSIGYSLSHGCIRMRIPDVEDLFSRVKVGTPVEII